MKITITRSEIKSIVTGFSKIISAKPSLTVLGYIRLDSRGGKLIAQATDLDQTATYCFENAELEGDIGVPVVGSVLIPFQLLKDLAKGSPTETISLATVDGKTVSVTSHVGSHSVTRTVDCFELDAWPDAGEDIPTTEANGFMASFRRVAQFTSVDSTREVLTGVLVDVGGQGDHNATLVATDGRRMTCCNSLKLVGNVRDGRDGRDKKDKKDDNDVIVPVTKFLTWTALPDEATLGVARDNLTTRICIKAGPWGYVTKGINGRYPNWRQVLPAQENMAHEVRFTDSEVGALRQILPTLPGKDAIVLEGKAGRLNLCAADDTGKTLTVPLTAGSTYTGSGCRLILDRRYLLDALNAGFRNFLFAGTEMPIRSQDDKGGIHVLMPLREDPIKTPSQAQSEASVNDPVAESTPATSATSAAPVKPATPVTSVTPMTSVTSIPPVSPSIVQPTAQSTPPPQEKQDMNNQNSQAAQATPVSALEALQASFDSAKAKLRDAQFALVEVGASLRDALKEERQRRSEAESVRSTLRKLQSIRV